VRDSGIGIQESILDKVFDPYFTTKHKSSMHSGTGLGLFIVHQHVQDHFGSIEVRSKVNEGTRFIISLPTGVPASRLVEQTPEDENKRSQNSSDHTSLCATFLTLSKERHVGRQYPFGDRRRGRRVAGLW
jgi:hypothetical protein